MQLGLQLYNFRRELASDFRGTMREIAKLGFDGVEFAGNYGQMPPDEAAAMLRELKLRCAGTMFSIEDTMNPDGTAYGYVTKLESPASTFSVITDFSREYQTVLEQLRTAGRAAAAHGKVFSYHNHWDELAPLDGTPVLERFLAETDPEQVFCEPDICWLNRGGVDAADFILRHASRIRQIHFKDILVADDLQTTTELGCGIIDLPRAWAAACEIDCPWVIYEQDNSSDPFRSAAESLAYLKKMQGC